MHSLFDRMRVTPLGQSGFRLDMGETSVLVDPYLSDYVEELEGPRARRLVPVVQTPDSLTDIEWTLVTHEHPDHCDPRTILPLAQASSDSWFMAPRAVCAMLEDWGIESERIRVASESWETLAPGVRVRAVPAAHPTVERDETGCLRYVGYLMDRLGLRVYHSGDTSVNQQIIQALQVEGEIDVGFIAVNERNYYRDRNGILGNMTIREAFAFAEEINARVVVPMHWDMFMLNRAYPEEIALLYDKLSPGFALRLMPVHVAANLAGRQTES